MTLEEKQLLLIDLCARFPYGVKLHIPSFSDVPQLLQEISDYDSLLINDYTKPIGLNDIKPYLRPMSSMTDKEQTEWHNTTLGQRWITENNIEKCVDWLNAHHFDYRGLIEKGLALEASIGMYKTQ